MSIRLHAALEATGLLSKYQDGFKEARVNDVQVNLCIKNPAYKMLNEVIESPDDYELFVHAFTNPEKYENDQLDDLGTVERVNEENKGSVNGGSTDYDGSMPRLHSILHKLKKQQAQFATSPSQPAQHPKNNKKSIKAFTHFLTTLKRHRFSKSETDSIQNQEITSSPSKGFRLRPFTHTMEPLQIIDIPLKKLNSGNALQFHREQLEEILSKVGRRPVALLTIAGPSRQGKSFMLSYMVKYLRSLTTQNQGPSRPDFDWIGKTGFKRSQPLLEGFLWRSGVERETTGIWMWPEPFTLKSPDGSEFDVLLMDTQGVFDDYTDKKDWATIVGLSLLTSSCLIFNIMNNLQEDSLITLKDFMDFGLMAMQPTDDAPGDSTNSNCYTLPPNAYKPFQKLLFLIRDWNNPDDYPFGAEGGSDFLRANLERKNTESGEHLRSQMKQCFEHLDCFLMPEPGSLVKRKTYDGSVAGMEPEFAENMEKFIEHIFSPSSFLPKIISGNLVTGDDLLLFFEQYVKIFNSDQMPSPQDMNDANATICNQTIVNKAIAIYEQGMEQLPDDSEGHTTTFILDSELESIHESSQNLALQLFHSSRKMGSGEQIEKFEGILLQRISEFYKLVSLENAKIQNDFIGEATQKVEEYFTSLMESKISSACSGGPDDFVTDDIFLSIFEECEALCLEFFQGCLNLTSLETVPFAQKIFDNVLNSLKQPMQFQNKIKANDAENSMMETITQLSTQYKSKLHAVIQKFKYWSQEQLGAEEEPLQKAAFSNFETLYSKSALYPKGIQNFTERLHGQISDVEKLVNLQNQNFVMACAFLVNELASNYTSKMETSAKSAELSATGHDEEKAHCLSSLKESQDFDRLPLSDQQHFIDDLSKRVSTTFQQLVDKWFPRIRQKSLNNYTHKMMAFIGTGETIFEERELTKEHDILKSSAVQEFISFTSNIPVPVFGELEQNVDPTEGQDQRLYQSSAQVLEDFAAEIDNLAETIYENNKLRSEATHETVQGFLSKAKTMYLQMAKQINETYYPKETIGQVLDEAKDKTLQYFKDHCNTRLEVDEESQPLPLGPFIHELEDFILSIAQFKKDGATTLEISAPSLKFSRELPTLETIQNQYSSIKEVRWIATKRVTIDANLCGEFWVGMNLVVCAPKVVVVGHERLIIVSGENGKSAKKSPPGTPEVPGGCGFNGIDGEPGESGGNIVILADDIILAENLRIISNGGVGGNGQPGGNGCYGVDGVSGDERFSMSAAELEMRCPSPAKIMDSQASLKKGLAFLQELASSNGKEVESLPCINSGSRCWSVETKGGAKIRYGFFQGGLKGLVKGRSFYVWLQGAPGTLGQKGGLGGLGGRGGQPGNPGQVSVPSKYEKKVKISRIPGSAGTDGREGETGKNGRDGPQGTDYAIVDPYAGLYIPSNFISKKRFSGRLGIYFVKFRQRNEAAFCPHEKKYMTFIEVYSIREGIKVHEDQPSRPGRKPMIRTRSKKQISKDGMQIKYSVHAYKPTPTVGRAGGFYVEESELRSLIENEFVGTSVIDMYATLLGGLHLNPTLAYLPSTAFSFTGGEWLIAQYLDDMIKTIKDNATDELTTIATIATAGKHWILYVANTVTGQIQIADTLNGYCNESKLQEGVTIFVKILDAIFEEMNWNMSYYPGIATQTDSHSCGPATLYFLEQLYSNSNITCKDPKMYQNYRKTIVERILLTTDEGKQILDTKNEYTKYLRKSTSTLI